eukprot:c28525_g2_i1 orf=422-1588(-)
METGSILVYGGAHCDSKRIVINSVESEQLGMGEIFQVDDLLDFSDDDIGGPIQDECTATPSDHASESSHTEAKSLSSELSQKFCARVPNLLDQIGQASGELCIPSDELAYQLEWLSNFVEDSYPADEVLEPPLNFSNSAITNQKTTDQSNMQDTFETRSPISVLEENNTFSSKRPCSFSPNMYIPGRARSKRSRTGGRVWSLNTLAPLGSTNICSGICTNILGGTAGDDRACSSEQESVNMLRPTKRPNKGKKVSEIPQPRRCTHCLVQKTPQWRAGPLGPKTLCNACGVRYKSGRLMPEYRPAGSPSFVTELHSNSHKKILEMRREKQQLLGRPLLQEEELQAVDGAKSGEEWAKEQERAVVPVKEEGEEYNRCRDIIAFTPQAVLS